MTISTDTITVTLPIPPLELSKNGRANWREWHRLFQRHKEMARLVLYSELVGERPLWSDPIWIAVQWFVASGRAPDTDNAIERLAAYVDGAQQAALIRNDQQVRGYRVTFGHDRTNPRVELTFERDVKECYQS